MTPDARKKDKNNKYYENIYRAPTTFMVDVSAMNNGSFQCVDGKMSGNANSHQEYFQQQKCLLYAKTGVNINTAIGAGRLKELPMSYVVDLSKQMQQEVVENSTGSTCFQLQNGDCIVNTETAKSCNISECVTYLSSSSIGNRNMKVVMFMENSDDAYIKLEFDLQYEKLCSITKEVSVPHLFRIYQNYNVVNSLVTMPVIEFAV